MARILVTTDYLHPGDEVDALLRRHGHQVSHHPAVGKRAADEALTLFDGIAGAIVASEPITAEMLDKAGELVVIARSGVGYDSIDVAAAAARGIRVCNSPSRNMSAWRAYGRRMNLSLQWNFAAKINKLPRRAEVLSK